ncbi:unnamed protein product [Darwinula stevensoni]|uniref:Uncharacterized protein n=1 Tax=Darwinula stevensoni TaxID=69355 RepID=A0A7R8XJE8_9CRUS|nr:unnamed protein product [Darwinula stevensoni]CAG0894739.1 unnamed protein product [Darwinula stevensoni]
MSKKCARCEKTVYPLEELKCLDKVWHKLCFKCQECGMSLNMRNYKGFNKLPYCEAHIPKPKATTVDETPELKRIAENTKIQSNIKYHADFEKARGKYTSVADDPETLRIRQHSKVISNVTYHGDLEKKADMEQKRQLVNANGDPGIIFARLIAQYEKSLRVCDFFLQLQALRDLYHNNRILHRLMGYKASPDTRYSDSIDGVRREMIILLNVTNKSRDGRALGKNGIHFPSSGIQSKGQKASRTALSPKLDQFEAFLQHCSDPLHSKADFMKCINNSQRGNGFDDSLTLSPEAAKHSQPVIPKGKMNILKYNDSLPKALVQSQAIKGNIETLRKKVSPRDTLKKAESIQDTLDTIGSSQGTLVATEPPQDSEKMESTVDSLKKAESVQDTLETIGTSQGTLVATEPNQDSSETMESTVDTLKDTEISQEVIETMESTKGTLKATEPSQDTLETLESSEGNLEANKLSQDALKTTKYSGGILETIESTQDALEIMKLTQDTLKTELIQDTLTNDSFQNTSEKTESSQDVMCAAELTCLNHSLADSHVSSNFATGESRVKVDHTGAGPLPVLQPLSSEETQGVERFLAFHPRDRHWWTVDELRHSDMLFHVLSEISGWGNHSIVWSVEDHPNVLGDNDCIDTGSQLPQQISRPQQQPPPKQVLPPQQRTVSPSKVPYDTGHMTSQGQSPYSSSRQSASTIIYTSQQGPVQQPTGDRHIGSIVDYDPLNNQYGSVATPYQGYTHPQTEHYPRGGGPPRGNPYAQSASYHGPPPQQPPHHHQPGHAYMQSRSPPKQSPGQSYGRCYRAMYDYSAGDADEVSFMDGDLIINCQQIDEGWMTGTVQRTGECGMLPANYVEPVN